MKNHFLTILFASILWTGNLSFAQTFTDTNAQLPGLESASAAWADYDNDGDLDLALTGFSSLVAERSFIFRNDNGVMVPVDSSIIKVSNGSVNWADFDNDGDQDLLINGQNNGSLLCELYRNDSLSFVPVNPGFIRAMGIQRWFDIDHDGFSDVIISGIMDSLWVDTTIVYRNNGNSTFSYFPTNLPGLLTSGMEVADYDNDSLPDIFILASNPDNLPVSALFHNNGNGNFTMDTVSFMQIYTGIVKWGDAEGDGDLDLLYDGILADNSAYTLIYLNDGAGNFSELPTNLPGTGEPGSVDWADIDHDGDLDVLLSEYLFRNDGSGVFTDVSPWMPHSFFSIPAMFADYDLDGDDDIFMLQFFGISNSTIFRKELLTVVPEFPVKNEMTVFPNPTKGEINILFDRVGVSEFCIYSIDGKAVKEFSSDGTSNINLSELMPGTYLLGIKNDAQFSKVKLVVK